MPRKEFASTNKNNYLDLANDASSDVVSQTSFRVETSGGITKCLLFSEAISRP